MNQFTIRRALEHFLLEDLGNGDVTSEAIFSAKQTATAVFIAKESLLTAGIASFACDVFKLVNPAITLEPVPDGRKVSKGDTILTANGPVLDLLKAERVALNLTQRLCGIATLTSEFVEQVALLPVKIVDTRKTTPGLRLFEKYAVRVGGGYNHRFNLSDGILIKDNHIAAAGSITKAINRVRNNAPHTIRIEVEAETVAQVEECLECTVDAILLDNMDCETMRKAVSINKGRVLLEASGGMNLENVRKVAETGVNLISVGALTHSATACDISMRMV
nr:carboxylating nicotinate-nucleotide diphosphorylase [Desulfobulbaceae bacterium]